MDLDEARRRLPPIWTIYHNPRDFPGRFVVRVFYGECAERDCTTHDTLEDARISVCARGASCNLHRAPADNPVIVESWI